MHGGSVLHNSQALSSLTAKLCNINPGFGNIVRKSYHRPINETMKAELTQGAEKAFPARFTSSLCEKLSRSGLISSAIIPCNCKASGPNTKRLPSTSLPILKARIEVPTIVQQEDATFFFFLVLLALQKKLDTQIKIPNLHEAIRQLLCLESILKHTALACGQQTSVPKSINCITVVWRPL